jgi:serine/threonine protein kinase
MTFGRYQVLSQLEPDCYLAADPLLDRRVLIHLMADFDWARQLARAGGPLIQRLLDMGSSHDQNYLVREVVEGRTLEEIGPDPKYKPALREALAHLHGHGLQHGDLRPANIVISPEGVLRLTNVRYRGRDDREAMSELEAWFG